MAGPSGPITPLLRFTPILGLAGFGGFVSLSYEIFFFRIMSYATGSSASSFAFVLGASLVGIALGAREAGDWCASEEPRRACHRILGALLTAALAGFAYLPILSLVAPFPGAPLALTLLFAAVVARAWGMVLPFLAHLGVAADRKAGVGVSCLYLANIIGSAAGSVATGFVLMDWFGIVQIAQIAQILGALGLGCITLLAIALPVAQCSDRRSYASVAADDNMGSEWRRTFGLN